MTLITPKHREDLPELEPLFKAVEASMGFVPESMYTMAHWPELLQSFAGMAGTVLSGGELDGSLKQLLAFVVSNAAGCRYCQAHTSHNAERAGVSEEKIQAAFEFETSDLFTDAERAALRVALHAGMVPNAVTPEHMAALQEHYSAKECVEIVATISLFGYLNRWNDTMATTLEDSPMQFAASALGAAGWKAGKHGN
ncbi:MAG: carboxymuconolactone decarboxylase family protein [Gammaproteobacteria bacterium]|nr:carboxymuconolactone decarboxylase family protein [Gammaproteobacteria bacterium]